MFCLVGAPKATAPASIGKLGSVSQHRLDNFFGPPSKKQRGAGDDASQSEGGQSSPFPSVPSSWAAGPTSDAASSSDLQELDGSEVVLVGEDVPPGQPSPVEQVPPADEHQDGADDKVLLTVENLMKHIRDHGITSLFESAMNMPLNKENLHALQKLLQKTGTEILEQGKAQSVGHGQAVDMASLDEAQRKRAETLKSVIGAGGFHSQSYLANQFRGEHKPGSEEGIKYKECKSRSEAAEFRVEWCKKQFQAMTEKKTFVQSWKRVDRTKGTYRNFGKLVLDFGGWECAEAIEGASTSVSRCMAMGHPWVQKHPQSGLVEYLVLQMEWVEEFESMWSHFQEHYDNEGSPAAAPAVGDSAEAAAALKGGNSVPAAATPAAPGPPATAAGKGAAKGTTAQPKSKAKKGAKPEGSPSEATGKGDEASPGDDKKKEFARLQRDALKLKQTFHSASSNYVQMKHAIDTDSSWSWTKCGPPETTKEVILLKAKTDLQNMLNDWHKEFLCNNDFSGIRKKYAPERLIVELTKFIEAKGAVDKLSTMLESMNRAHVQILNTA
jgi:hypothetical protein